MLSVTLDDCEVQGFSAGGPGGQHQNKRHTAQRVIHHASGARGESREFKSQLQNKKAAFRRMAEDPKFKIWLNKVLATGPTPEERVDRDMDPSRIKVEVQQGGKWTIVE